MINTRYLDFINNRLDQMGICYLSMVPEERVINAKNKDTLMSMRIRLKQLKLLGFSKHILDNIANLQSRYLFNQGVLQDIESIDSYIKTSILKRSSSIIPQKLQQEIKRSCLILQDQSQQLKNKESEDLHNSFQNNLRKNTSIVMQIDILYSKEIDHQLYNQSLRLFLKWAQMYQQHSYGGFLKPIYVYFCNFIYTIPMSDFSTIVDQTCVFVQFMVATVTQIYGLNKLASFQCGKLIKNQNIYNLIMSIIFKRTKIRKFLSQCINSNEGNKIKLFQSQIQKFHRKPTHFFGISPKFTLHQYSLTESQINMSIQQKEYVQPYNESLKLVNQLCSNGTPITKLKTIVSIAKQIPKDIQRYYQLQQKQAPELDPDNLTSIVIYLITKNGNKNIYEQLKMVQNFTTANCLSCISGYYLNVFIASMEAILTLQQSK